MTTPERDEPLSNTELERLRSTLALVRNMEDNEDAPEWTTWYVGRIVATISAREKAARIAGMEAAADHVTYWVPDMPSSPAKRIRELIEKERAT